MMDKLPTDHSANMFASFLFRAVLLTMIWWLVSGDIVQSWWFALPLILIASYVSICIGPASHRIRLVPLICFIPHFLRESIRGGFDVARRACSLTPVVNPDFIDYPLSLPEGSPRVMFAHVVSLLPGTLGSGFKDNTLRIHILDSSTNITADLMSLETRIAAIYAIDLNKHEQSHKEISNETL